MVDIMPFRGFRPPVHLVDRIVELPYDVIESDEARVLSKDNPYSFFHIAKSEVDVAPSISLYDDRVYAQGAENLRKFVNNYWLAQDTQPCFYVYAQRMGQHSQIGLVAGASVLEYQNNIIKKHELTRIDKENDRVRHIDTLNANDEPVFFTYRRCHAIDTLISNICTSAPTYHVTTSDHIVHTFWTVADPIVVKKIQEAFREVNFMYIADGHHRSAASVRVCESRKAKNSFHTGNESYNYFMTVIFPDNQMQILPYNRVIKDLHEMTPEDFMTAMKLKFDIAETTTAQPAQKHQIGMFLGDRWYCLTAKPEIVHEDDVIERLDVSILQNQVLAPLLGIENPRKDERIKFVGGIKGTEVLSQKVIQNQKGVAFAMYPTTMEDLMAIADAGKIMPPKSTWFEPKLRSGFVVRPLI